MHYFSATMVIVVCFTNVMTVIYVVSKQETDVSHQWVMGMFLRVRGFTKGIHSTVRNSDLSTP